MLVPNYKVPWHTLKKRPLSFFLLSLVRAYQLMLSPLVGRQCRHIPTCSNFMLEAIVRHGPFKGTLMGIKRVTQCGPGGTCGYHPVPPVKEKE